jgi:hypothetical protein
VGKPGCFVIARAAGVVLAPLLLVGALAGCAAASPTSTSTNLGGLVGSWKCDISGQGDVQATLKLDADGSGTFVSIDGTVPFAVTNTSTGFKINGKGYQAASAVHVKVANPLPRTGKVSGTETDKDYTSPLKVAVNLKANSFTFVRQSVPFAACVRAN